MYLLLKYCWLLCYISLVSVGISAQEKDIFSKEGGGGDK